MRSDADLDELLVDDGPERTVEPWEGFMIELNWRNCAAFLAAGGRHGYPERDVLLAVIADDVGWSLAETVDFAWEGHGVYWDTGAGMGCPPTVLEAP